MTLGEKISLVENLIMENPDVTIKEYVETILEIAGIRKSTFFIVKQSDFPVLEIEPVGKKRKYYQCKYVTPAKIRL